MSVRPTICSHCGAENLPVQEVCEACGKRLSAFVALKPTIAGLGAVWGGIIAVIPQFLLILLFCQFRQMCDYSSLLSIYYPFYCPLAGVTFFLGAIVGYAIPRIKLMGLVEAVAAAFIVGILSTCPLFTLLFIISFGP